MLEYYRIDISEGIDVNTINVSKKCDICHYCYFFDKYEPYLCDGCHNLIQKARNFNVMIVSVKGNDYKKIDIKICLKKINKD